MLKAYHYGSLRKYVDLLKKIGVMAAGLGISGALGAISGILLLYVLVDAAIAGANDAVWLYLCAAVGIIVGGICFKVVLWAGRGNKVLR
ncbi:MAG: hypothetical protein ACKVG2_02240 [Candidatus Poseidoniales archaeon]|jgi:hypothetical protein|tara:strand:- start:188 stop:454 length:267 start_codon:yes stop_codon:yes gene_type:complete